MKGTKILSTDTFRYKPLNGYIQEYFNKTHVDYNYNLAGNSISVILYKMDTDNSTTSDGSNTVLDLIGPESPYKYIKIKNVPLFNVQQTQVSTDWSENSGYGSEIQIECVANPTVLAIDVDDYIVFDYSSYRRLFRVIRNSPDTFEDISYNSLTLISTQYTEENIEFQVSKRFSFIFETAGIIDEGVNNTLNDILSISNTIYTNFMAEFYVSQGLIMRMEELDSLDRYFKFKDVSLNSILYSYFFKKYIARSLITINVNVDEILDVYFRTLEIKDPIVNFTEDPVKLIYFLIKNLESNKNALDSLQEAKKEYENIRKELLKKKPKIAFLKYERPFEDIFTINKDFFKLYEDILRDIINGPLIIDNKSIKTLGLLKKITKMMFELDRKDPYRLFMNIMYFFLLNSIPFKQLKFNKTSLDYGK